MIEVSEISFAYGKNLLFSEVSFNVTTGSVLGVVGRSGCGKSTLIRLLCGLLKPSIGSIFVDEKIVKIGQKGIGVVFQDPIFMSWKTVRENLDLPIRLLGRKPDIKAIGFYIETMSNLRGQDVSNLYPAQLSSGFRQLLCFFMTLSLRPRILYLDEPFSSVDMLTRENINYVLNDFVKEQKITTVLVTHDLIELSYLADKIIVLDSIDPDLIGSVDTNKEFRESSNYFDQGVLNIAAIVRNKLNRGKDDNYD